MTWTATDHQAATAATVDVGLRTLTRRFNYAFRATRDLEVAMAVVNELVERPLSYREFWALLNEGEPT